VRGTVFLGVRISLSVCKGLAFCTFFVRGHGHDRNGGGGGRSCSQCAACGSISTGIEHCLRKAVNGPFGLSRHRSVISVEQGLERGLARTAILLRAGSRHFFQAEEAGFVQSAPYGFGYVRNIGACDVFQSLVINGQGDDAVTDGFAVRPLDLNGDVALFTGSVLGFARHYGRSQKLSGGRNQKISGSLMKFSVSDGEGVDAHIGHIFPGQAAFHKGCLPVQGNQTAGFVFPGVAQEGPDVGVRIIRGDEQPGRISRSVFLFVRMDGKRIDFKRILFALAVGKELEGFFHLVAVPVLQGCGKGIQAGFPGLEGQGGFPIFPGGDIPGFQRFPSAVRTDMLQDAGSPGMGNFGAIRRGCGNGCPDRRSGGGIAAVQGGEDIKRTESGNDLSGSGNFPQGGVRHADGNAVGDVAGGEIPGILRRG